MRMKIIGFCFIIAGCFCASAPEQTTNVLSLPSDIWSRISNSIEDTFALGSTNKELFALTRPKNTLARLSQIKQYCGFMTYLEVTSSPYLIFNEPTLFFVSFDQQYRCLRALTACHQNITLSSLELFLPERRNRSLTFNHLSILEMLLRAVGKIKAIRITRIGFEKFDDSIEKRIFDVLRTIPIDTLHLSFSVSSPDALIGIRVNKLHVSEFRHKNRANRVTSLKTLSLSKITHPNTLESLMRVFNNPKQVELNIKNVPEAASMAHLESLVIKYNFPYSPVWINALLNCKVRLKNFFIDENVSHYAHTLNHLLTKLDSLESLSFGFEEDNMNEMDSIARLLKGYLKRVALKRLCLVAKLEEDPYADEKVRGLDHTFLSFAGNLSAYILDGSFWFVETSVPLFKFVKESGVLEELSLKSKDTINSVVFLRFLDALVDAVKKNDSRVLKWVNFRVRIRCTDRGILAKEIVEKLKGLIGMNILFNGVPIEKLVKQTSFESGEAWNNASTKTLLNLNRGKFYHRNCISMISS